MVNLHIMSFYRNLILITLIGFISMMYVEAVAKSRVEYMTYEAMRQDIPPAEAIAIIDSIFKKDLSAFSPSEKADLLKRKAKLAMSIGNYSAALKSLTDMKNYYEASSQEETIGFMINEATCDLYNGDYPSAVRLAFDVLAEKKNAESVHADVDAYILLANVSNRIGAIEESRKYLDRASELAREIPSDSLRQIYIYRIMLGKSSWLILTKNYKEAYDTLIKTGSMRYGQDVMPFCQATNMAIVYENVGENEMAEKYYKDILHSDKLHHNKCVALNNYTAFLLKNNRMDDALEVMDINLTFLTTVNARHDLFVRQMMRYKALGAKGDLASAIQSVDSAVVLLAELVGDENQRMYRQISEWFDTKSTADELVSVRKKLNISVLFMAILIIACIWLIWRLTRLKRRNVELRQLHVESRADLEVARNEYEQTLSDMQEKINHRTRQLAMNELKNVQLVNKLENITNELKSKEHSPANISDIRKSISDIHHDKSDWDSFEKYFEQVHPNFYKKLVTLHSDLTSGERRMCAFILTGMKTAEIATLCHRSTRTVESMKYRLKKKLNIQDSLTLDKYLISLAAE